VKRIRRANRTGSVVFSGRHRWIYTTQSGVTRTGFATREEAEAALEQARVVGAPPDARFRYGRPLRPGIAITPADIKWAQRHVSSAARKHPHLADDIRAEAVFALWLAALDYRADGGVSSLRSFAKARVWGSAIDFLRTQNRSVRNAVKRKHPEQQTAARIVVLDEVRWERVPAIDEPLDDLLDARRSREQLVRMIGGLRERDAAMVRMHVFDELQLKEIARAYGLTESRVSQIVSRALAKLAGKKVSLKRIAA